MKDGKCMRILAIDVNSIFQDFESVLRTEVDLVEDDIKLVLDDTFQVLSLMNYNRVFIFSKIFLRVSLGFFNLNMKDITMQLIFKLITLPGKLDWL